MSAMDDKNAAIPGNASKYDLANQPAEKPSVLTGKRILFLGNSVTYGAASRGQSFVDLFAALDGVQATMEALSGTTLVDRPSARAEQMFDNGDSNVTRLQKYDAHTDFDAIVCQLFTNDATTHQPLGEISLSFDPSDFDVLTITGALEFIASYCSRNWSAPLVFYTGSYYENSDYSAMVTRLHELAEKWHFAVIDLFSDSAFNAIPRADHTLFMADPIHPTKAGYLRWWYPEMKAQLIKVYRNDCRVSTGTLRPLRLSIAATLMNSHNSLQSNFLSWQTADDSLLFNVVHVLNSSLIHNILLKLNQ